MSLSVVVVVVGVVGVVGEVGVVGAVVVVGAVGVLLDGWFCQLLVVTITTPFFCFSPVKYT